MTEPSAMAVADMLYKHVLMGVAQHIPFPDCARARSRAEFKRAEAVKLLIGKLGGNEGMVVEVVGTVR